MMEFQWGAAWLTFGRRQVQVSVLRLLGTSLYPVVDSMLIACGIEQKLLRYRIHMSALGAALADLSIGKCWHHGKLNSSS